MNVLGGNAKRADTKHDGLIAKLMTRLDHLEDMNKELNETVDDLKGRLSRRKRHIAEKYEWDNQTRSRSRSRNHNTKRGQSDDDSYY